MRRATFVGLLLFLPPVFALQESPTRERVCLNGTWRFKPVMRPSDRPPQGEWGRIRVPGWWRAVWGAGETGVFNREGRRIDSWEGKPISDYDWAWHERSFQVPERWRGRKVFVHFERVAFYAKVFVNGEYVGEHMGAFSPFEFEVTEHVLPGEWNRLQVLVGGAITCLAHPRKPIAPDFFKDSLWQIGKGHGSQGIWGDVWLEARPEVFVENVYIVTSWRRKEIEVEARIVNLSEGPVEVTLVNAVLDREKKRFVLEFPPRRAKVPPGGRVEVRTRRKWPNPIPWCPESPYLYWLSTKLFVKGKGLSDFLRTRFGFREVWVKDGAFYLNGRRVRLYGESAYNTLAIHMCDRRFARLFMRVLKRLGMNCFRPHGTCGPEFLLDIADEEGILVDYESGVVFNYYRWDDERFWRNVEEEFRAWIEEGRNHPSLFVWSAGNEIAGYYCCPARYDDENFPPKHPPKERCRRLARIIRKFDRTRPVMHHGDGNIPGSEVINFHVYDWFSDPLDEYCEWPSAWARTRRKPLVFGEFGFPYYHHYMRQYDPRDVFARWMGDEVYPLPGERRVRREEGRADFILADEARVKAKAVFCRRLVRAWRYYGVSGILPFAQLWLDGLNQFDFKGKAVPSGGEGKPGPILDSISRVILNPGWDKTAPQWLPNELTRAMADSFRPLLCYIGGPPENPVARERNYFSGERARRTLVVANDTPGTVRLNFVLELLDRGGKVLWRRKLGGEVEEGRSRAFPFSFAVPRVMGREEFTLRLLRGGREVDALRITVFPRPGRLRLRGRVTVYDPKGETEEILRKAGVKFERAETLKPPPSGILVVGKEALSQPRFEEWAEIGRFVARGGRLLVFEQGKGFKGIMPLLGMMPMEARARNAFIRCRSHPVLRGFEDEDFSYWRGETDLVSPPYPDCSRRWGTRGIVSSFPFAKRATPGARFLLDCWVGLSYSPLVELRKGRGTAIFCQLDITSRYGREPVATLLLHRLLKYLDRYEPEEPKLVLYYGEERRDEAVLSLLHPEGLKKTDLPSLPEGLGGADIFVVGSGVLPRLKGVIGEVSEFVRRGGRVLILPQTGVNPENAGEVCRLIREEKRFCAFIEAERLKMGRAYSAREPKASGGGVAVFLSGGWADWEVEVPRSNIYALVVLGRGVGSTADHLIVRVDGKVLGLTRKELLTVPVPHRPSVYFCSFVTRGFRLRRGRHRIRLEAPINWIVVDYLLLAEGGEEFLGRRKLPLPFEAYLKPRTVRKGMLKRRDWLCEGLSNALVYGRKGEAVANGCVEVEGGEELISPGLLVAKRWGKGFFLFSQVLPGKGERAKEFYLNLLSNLGARVERGVVFLPLRKAGFVDLRPFCNMGFRDEKEGDGKGGWSDQGENDLREFPVGIRYFGPVPFEVINPEENEGKSCIMLAGKHRPYFPKEVKGIRVGARARRLFFLHGCAWSAKPGEEVVRFTVNYADGSKEEIPVIYGRHVENWWHVVPLPEAEIGWVGSNPVWENLAIYVMEWRNPKPEVPIKTLDVRSLFRECVYGLIAITFERFP